MKNIIKIIFCFVLYAAALAAQTNPGITSSDLKKHLSYLASDEMKGRLSGSKEIHEAAVYLAKQLQFYGLKPAFKNCPTCDAHVSENADKNDVVTKFNSEAPGYLQKFTFVQDIKFTENNKLEIGVFERHGNVAIIDGPHSELKLNFAFVTAPFSGAGNVSRNALGEKESNLVFAGYGIYAPKLHYDDYSGIDVKGKVVLVMRGTPENENPHSDFDKYASLRNKATTAMNKGAAGIIFVNGYIPKDDDDKFMSLKYDRAAGLKDFPVIQIKRGFADELFRRMGMNFKTYQEKIKDSSTTAPFEFKYDRGTADNPSDYVYVQVSLSTEVEEVNAVCNNVGAILEGSDPELQKEYVVIGAHYDHLGMGVEGSLYKGKDEQIHNGADDNASGTAAVLELAQKFASDKERPKRSILFLFFSGEELGLLGSAHFVNNSPIPVEQISAMINLDMVGRLDSTRQLTIYGTGTSSQWKKILNEKNTDSMKLAFVDEGYGPSDQTSFYAKKIPVLFFFTGVHTDYHRPSDDADLINYDGEETITNYVYEASREIASLSGKPDYVDIPRKESSGGWKVYVGTIPDYSTNVEGFRLTGVSPGSPAEKGGLKGGDIMIKFGDRKIANIYDYVYALQDHVPGDEVEVIIKRNNEEHKFKVLLGAK